MLIVAAWGIPPAYILFRSRFSTPTYPVHPRNATCLHTRRDHCQIGRMLCQHFVLQLCSELIVSRQPVIVLSPLILENLRETGVSSLPLFSEITRSLIDILVNMSCSFTADQ